MAGNLVRIMGRSATPQLSKFAGLVSMLVMSAVAHAQIPDMLNALDAGSRSTGMGSSLLGTGADTHSVLNNPAGLGYVSSPSMSLSFRNLPESSTTARNDFRNPDLSTKGEAGDFSLTHLGYVRPNKRGAVGVSYTVTGFVRDQRVGLGELTLDAGSTVRNYREKTQAKIDMFAASIGTKSKDGLKTYGAGLVVASTHVQNRQSYDIATGGITNPATPINSSGTGTGIGLVVGAQMIPAGNRNLILGLSARTPIDLRGNDNTKDILDKIPGKIQASAALRKNGLGGGDDYAIYGAYLERYFRGETGQFLSRKGVFTGGFGVEYNKATSNARIPVRLGYQFVPKGGDGFKDRSSITFGLGYRPYDSNIGVDLSFGSSSQRGFDAGISLSYRLNK